MGLGPAVLRTESIFWVRNRESLFVNRNGEMGDSHHRLTVNVYLTSTVPRFGQATI